MYVEQLHALPVSARVLPDLLQQFNTILQHLSLLEALCLLSPMISHDHRGISHSLHKFLIGVIIYTRIAPTN